MLMFNAEALMFGQYFLLLTLGAGDFFLSVIGFVTIEEAIVERRKRRSFERPPSPMRVDVPDRPEHAAATTVHA